MRAAESGGPSAVVAAGDEETRILLRGLLRLHHVRVEGEARNASVALELLRRVRPSLLVLDVDLADGGFEKLLAGARAQLPGLRIVLVAPSSRPPPALPDGPAPDVTLLRPFRIRAFAEAIAPSAGGAPPGPPP